MARRRNSIAKRFAKMRGLPPQEKALMQRIADLMDAALNNRQASNPFEASTTRLNRQVYPPTGLLAQSGISSVKIIWDPANSNEHLRYEIEFLNLTTGESTTKTSFTNEIVFRSSVGTYLAKVASVGRDGSKSSLKQVEFNMGDDVMLIEGAKNGAQELGTVIQDNMQLYKGFSVYVWGSVVLDKQTLDTNGKVVFRLYRAEIPDATWGTTPVTLEQEITLYAATESASSLDTTARGGNISRPIVVRPGAFETSQSLMFSPIAVDDADDEKVVTYFLQAVNRQTEVDEVALSLTMWSGMDGVGSAVPGDVFVPPTPYVFPNLNSYHNQTPLDPLQFPFDRRTAHAVVPDGYSLIGNEWTVAFWIRFDDLAGANLADVPATDPNNTGNLGTKVILSRGTISTDNDTDLDNSWDFAVNAGNLGGGEFQHQITLSVNWFTPQSRTPAIPAGRFAKYVAACTGDREHISSLFPYGDAISASKASGNSTNNGWMFMVICFGGGDFVDTANPKIRLYMNIGTDPVSGEPNDPPTMALAIPSLDTSTQEVVQTDVGKMGYQMGPNESSFSVGRWWNDAYTGDLGQYTTKNMAYNQMGIWNVALDSDVTGTGWNIGPINALYNKGRGTAVDWKGPITTTLEELFAYQNYIQYENLIHLVQFGAVERPFRELETLRDTGFFLPGGNLNFTQDVRENDYFETWHQTNHTVHNSEDRFHQIQIPFESGLADDWYANFGQSWSRGTDIYDILSPTGSNGTTQYDYAYPGQNL